MKKKEIKNIGRILAILGALVSVVFGLLYVAHTPFTVGQYFFISGLTDIIDGIVLIILGLIIFASYGLLNISLKFKVSWLMILIMGILVYVFGGGLAALLLILSAIVYIIAEL